MKNKSLIYIYTGNGKGKTTAAIGLAIRAIGWGKKVAFFQFLKCGNFVCGEEKILKKIKNIKFVKFNQQSPLFFSKVKVKDLIKKINFDLKKVYKTINSGKYEIVILDELTYLFKLNILKSEEFFKKIRNRPESVEIIITGRYAPKGILNKADLVTEMKKIKHPFDKGINARKGIDF